MAETARRRFVVLGASNVALGLAPLVGWIRALEPTLPVEILCAHGHGRSYGVTTRVFFRELPAIGECGLWRALESARAAETQGAREPRPTQALVTDVGNDLAYGSSVDRVAGWVERDLDRLQGADARIVLSRMPIASLERLTPRRFALARSILFPGRTIELAVLLEAMRALDARLVATARARAITTVEPGAEWYGLDPIHVRRSRRSEAFRVALATLGPVREPRAATAVERASLRRLRPEFRRFFGREQRLEQPGACFADGTSIAWY